VPNLIGGEEVRTGRWMPVVTPHAHAVALTLARADRLVLKGGSTDDQDWDRLELDPLPQPAIGQASRGLMEDEVMINICFAGITGWTAPSIPQ
jgi:hypothetical protein